MASQILKYRLLPWQLALGLILAINAVTALVVTLRIDFNNAPELYFPKDAPSVITNNRIRAEFPNDEFLIGVFYGPDLYSDTILRGLDKVAKRMEQHPMVDRVFTATNTDHIAATEDGFEVEPLLDIDKLSELSPAQRRERLLADRFAPGIVVAHDGSALALFVRPRDLKHSLEREAVEKAFYQAVREAGMEKYLVSVAGQVALDSAQLLSMLADTTALTPITIAIGIVMLLWVVGRPAPVVIGAVAMSTVVFSAIGTLAAIGQPFTLVSSMVSPLLAAYTAATLLHLYAALYRARQAGLRRPERVLRAVNDVHKAALFNVLTTGAGMISFVLTPIPPIQVFGIVGAVGALLVYLVVFHLVPPLLVKWDRGPWPRRKAGFRWTRLVAFGLASFAMRRAGWVLAGMAVAMLLLVPYALRVQVESDLLKFFPPGHALTQSTDVLEDKLSGVTTLVVLFEGQGRDALKHTDKLRALKEFQNWLDQQPEVDRSVSMMDVVEEMNWAFHGEETEQRRLPDNDKLLSQLLLLYDGNDLHELVNREYDRTRIVVSLNVHGARAIASVIDRIHERMKTHPVADVRHDIGGYGRLFADQERLLVLGQVQSFAGAFIQIFIILAILWRSVSAAGICLIPNLAPLFFIFVIMGATGIRLDMATSLIAAVILGITVDDTIHLYQHYKHRLEQGCSHTYALARSFEASGRAVLAVTVVLVAQFSFLMGSKFIPTANFGMLAAIGLVAGQLFELMLLPALLVLRDRWQNRPPSQKTLKKVRARRQAAGLV